MSRRTRKTPGGLKTRFRRKKPEHGPIVRLVGSEPLQTLAAAAAETLAKDIADMDTFTAAVTYAKKDET